MTDHETCASCSQRLDAEDQLVEQADEIERLFDALSFYEGIALNSVGVVGWHLNGEIAKWSEFDLPRC